MRTRSVWSRVLLCVKHTLQKKASCLQQVSLYSTGHIPIKSGSDPNYYLGHWVIRVSGTDPVSTLLYTKASQLRLFTVNAKMFRIRTNFDKYLFNNCTNIKARHRFLFACFPYRRVL